MTEALVAGPTVEPVTLAEVKAHCRVDTDDEDGYLGGLIAVARETVEIYTRRALLSQTWRAQADRWAGRIELGKGPVQSVVAVRYRNSLGVQTTVPTDTYLLEHRFGVTSVVLRRGLFWPDALLGDPDSITVEYVAGYGPAPSDVPAGLRHALLLIAGHLYENREVVSFSQNQPAEIPMGAKSLMAQHRIVSL